MLLTEAVRLHLADIPREQGGVALSEREDIYDDGEPASVWIALINSELPPSLTLHADGTVRSRTDYYGDPKADVVAAIAAVDGPDQRGFWRLSEPHIVAADVEFTAAADVLGRALHRAVEATGDAVRNTGRGFTANAAAVHAELAAIVVAVEQLQRVAAEADSRRAAATG